MKSAQSRLSKKRLHDEIINENETTVHSEKQNGIFIFLDCSVQSIGRIGPKIADVINNKYDIDFSRHAKHLYRIVLYNYESFILTGNKMADKFYVKYTGYAGGQRTMKAVDIYNKNPRTFFEHVFSHMLNKNRSRQQKLNNIMYFPGLPPQNILKLRDDNYPVQKAVQLALDSARERA